MTPAPAETTRLTLRLRNDLADALAEQPEVTRDDRSLNWQINQAVETYLEHREQRDVVYPPPLPESEFGQSGRHHQAVLGFQMPMFDFDEDTDHEGQVSSEDRIVRMLTEMTRVARAWGCTDKVVWHSIFGIGGDQLPNTITAYPEQTLVVEADYGALGSVVSDDPVLANAQEAGRVLRAFAESKGGPLRGWQAVNADTIKVGDQVSSYGTTFTVDACGVIAHQGDEKVLCFGGFETAKPDNRVTMYRGSNDSIDLLVDGDSLNCQDPYTRPAVMVSKIIEQGLTWFIASIDGEQWLMEAKGTIGERGGVPIYEFEGRLKSDVLATRSFFRSAVEALYVMDWMDTTGYPLTDEERIQIGVAMENEDTISWDAPTDPAVYREGDPRGGGVQMLDTEWSPDTSSTDALKDSADDALDRGVRVPVPGSARVMGNTPSASALSMSRLPTEALERIQTLGADVGFVGRVHRRPAP